MTETTPDNGGGGVDDDKKEEENPVSGWDWAWTQAKGWFKLKVGSPKKDDEAARGSQDDDDEEEKSARSQTSDDPWQKWDPWKDDDDGGWYWDLEKNRYEPWQRWPRSRSYRWTEWDDFNKGGKQEDWHWGKGHQYRAKTHMPNPPKLDRSKSSYTTWRKELDYWSQHTSVPWKDQASSIYFSLETGSPDRDLLRDGPESWRENYEDLVKALDEEFAMEDEDVE